MTKLIVALRNFAIDKCNAAENFYGRNVLRSKNPPHPSFWLGEISAPSLCKLFEFMRLRPNLTFRISLVSQGCLNFSNEFFFFYLICKCGVCALNVSLFFSPAITVCDY